MVRQFEEEAPTSSAEAAKAILDGVRLEQWRILIGADAHRLDQLVRETPEAAYEPAFTQRMRDEGLWRAL